MAEFRRERVFFTVIGQGSIDIEYEVGAQTPEQKFRDLYDGKARMLRLAELLRNTDDFDHVITVATEPRHVPGEEDWCPDCGATGMVMQDDREVTCGTCGGAKVLSGPALDEIAPF